MRGRYLKPNLWRERRDVWVQALAGKPLYTHRLIVPLFAESVYKQAPVNLMLEKGEVNPPMD